MTQTDILRLRLANQNLSQQQFNNPADLVSWMGAMQAQDFYGAKWALGLRLKNSLDSEIEKAFNEGAILRTHVLRPTWHFVSRDDIRWMLRLTAKRIIAFMASQYRQLELDATIIKRCNAALRKTLKGGKHLVRNEIALALNKAGVATDGLRFIHLMMRAELDEVICSGPRTGKQFTYALLNERAPNAKSLNRNEALAELSLRYFKSHGPATLKDFAWWSGLTIADARDGVEMNKSKLMKETIERKSYWFAEDSFSNKRSTKAFLLPNYDEYLVAYSDRSLLIEDEHSKKTPRGGVLFNHSIIADGKVVGTWQRSFKNNKIVIEKKLLTSLNATQQKSVDVAMQRYSKFIGMEIR